MTHAEVGGAVGGADAALVTDDVLAEWVTAQRWFGAKTRDVGEVNALDTIILRDEAPALALVIIEARFRAGTHELYQLPIGVRPAAEGWDRGVIRSGERSTIYDALSDATLTAVLVALMQGSAQIDRPEGLVRFHAHGRAAGARVDPHATVRAMDAEQSNTSVVLDERLVLKVFRRIEPGINPELEMLSFLSAHGFEHIAALGGSYGYAGRLMEATLGVMQSYVTPAANGWGLALRAIETADNGFLDRIQALGEITGRMHSVLSSDPSTPDFAPEEPSDESVSLLTATIDEEVERLFAMLPDRPELRPIAGRGDEVRDHLRQMSHTGIGGRLIRVHGDYHLGQAVYGPRGWVILDFEGEPARPLLERRRKRSPLRDVAGMLRSFAYAASATVLLGGAAVPDGWESRARERYLAGYLSQVEPVLLPAGRAAIDRLLFMFELEKAIYELRYELNHRPDWVGVPVAAITRLLEEPSV